MGSEGAGIPSEILSCVPETIFVPPFIRPGPVDTTVDSLNVSVAAGIIINKLCQKLRNT